MGGGVNDFPSGILRGTWALRGSIAPGRQYNDTANVSHFRLSEHKEPKWLQAS
jgi:hypothetical protein